MAARKVNRYLLGAVIVTSVLLLICMSNREEFSGQQHATNGSGQDFRYLRIDAMDIPETVLINGVPGFRMCQLVPNLYLRNGTWIAVVSDKTTIPDVASILSAFPEDNGIDHRPAKDDRWRVVRKGEVDVRDILGELAVRKAGISMFFNDQQGKNSVSFLKHYFHFGEVFLGGWRVLTAAGETDLPARLMYRTTPDDWRDHAGTPTRPTLTFVTSGLTSWFQQSVMPDTAIEEASVWDDRAKSGMTFLFDKITIIDRWAAHAKGENPKYWNKMTADLVLLNPPLSWMDPLRLTLKELAETQGCSIQRKKREVPILTYVNRQLTGRRLVAEDANALKTAMQNLHDEDVIEFYDAYMENLSRVEQFCLALRSDIIMGVHGNGLSHALWMRPGSAMIELMKPGGFAMDYAMIGQLMRHDYYAIHNNRVFPSEEWRKPDGYGVGQNAGFHGNAIPVDAAFMSTLVRKIAKERTSVVDT